MEMSSLLLSRANLNVLRWLKTNQVGISLFEHYLMAITLVKLQFLRMLSGLCQSGQ
jgi:hypothetical protein